MIHIVRVEVKRRWFFYNICWDPSFKNLTLEGNSTTQHGELGLFV